jgi:hypothetical protein
MAAIRHNVVGSRHDRLPRWESGMKRFCTTSAAVALVMAGVWVSQVEAAPPTVTPSPGYDARLQEQRAASRLSAPADAPIGSPVRPVYRHRHVRHAHDYY